MTHALDGLATVITPAHNSSADIAAVVSSVSRQTVAPLEHIIIDDGSSDGSYEIALELSRSTPWLRIIRQPHSGAAVARNRGISEAKGRYIVFLDADDRWSPLKLEVQLRFMLESDSVFSFGDYETVHRTRGALGSSHLPDVVTHRALLRGCPIGCLTVAFDRERLGRTLMPNVRQGQDWGLWLRLTRAGAVARKYPGVHATYFTGGSSLSRNKLRKLASIYSLYREDEGASILRSSALLAAHAISSLIKKL